MINNVVKIKGTKPVHPEIKDMKKGDVGYTVAWAYDEKTNTLDEHFMISSKPGGTINVRVKCEGDGRYSIKFLCREEY